MFSGIVETTSPVLAVDAQTDTLRIRVGRPADFTDVKTGDSIAIDGICLTLETFTPTELTFALGPETLRVTGWTAAEVLDRVVNLERSLRLNDRIHGHLVTGHVDALGTIAATERTPETLGLTVAHPPELAPYFWPKGSVAINGVSLTINQTGADWLRVHLIPETLKRTSLGRLEKGHKVNLEIDNMARGLVHFARAARQEKA